MNSYYQEGSFDQAVAKDKEKKLETLEQRKCLIKLKESV